MSVTLYGIPNCDTVKKARKWLEARGTDYGFHDYKKAGVPDDRLRAWVDKEGWEVLLNKRGTTFRKLPDADKADIDTDKAIALMIEHPSMIKRPVVEHDGGLLIGFDADAWDNSIQ